MSSLPGISRRGLPSG